MKENTTQIIDIGGREKIVQSDEFIVNKWCECCKNPKSLPEIDRMVYYKRSTGEHGYICTICGGLIQSG